MASTRQKTTPAKRLPAEKKTVSSSRSQRTISVAHAKANLSSVLSGVEQSRRPVTILRRGIAVAQIIPFVDEAHAPLYGSMRGTVTELGDVVGPTGEDWGMGNA